MKKIKDKKKKVLIALILLLIILLLATSVGITFSKYRSEIRGRGNMTIANWSFTVNGNNETLNEIQLLNTYNPDTLVNGKIAPGTEGSFDIFIDASSCDVGVEYSVKFYHIDQEPDNIIYKYNGQKVNSLKELERLLTGEIHTNESSKQRVLTVEWEWPYQTGNTADEILSADKTDTQNSEDLVQFKFEIFVIGVQSEPERM